MLVWLADSWMDADAEDIALVAMASAWSSHPDYDPQWMADLVTDFPNQPWLTESPAD